MREPVRLRDSKEGGCFPAEPAGLADRPPYAPLERAPARHAALPAMIFSEAQARPLPAARCPSAGHRN